MVLIQFQFEDNFYNLSCNILVYENDKNEILLSEDNLLERQDIFNFISYLNSNSNEYENN